ncbi:hypothetical protein VTH82DRAFT_6243 [Thermothelomyces myriococcoides]
MSSTNLSTLTRTRSHRSIFVEDFGSPSQSPNSDINVGNRMPLPTPRDVHRLASDHDFVYGAHPAPRRLGWWAFMATHISLPAALIAGIIFVVVAIVYTSELGKQMLECPQWANECNIADDWTIENLGTVQGIITMVYMIGMASLAYALLGLCETTVWPLLKIQSFTINGLNAYLSVTRGSIMSAPQALMSVRSLAAAIVLACALDVTLLPFAGPPLIGHAYSPTLQAVDLESNYTSGGGISELYAQTNSPTLAMVRAFAVYNTWAVDPDSEPMPEYRDWYIDRETLSERGDFTARAVRFQTSISCRPHQVEQANWKSFRTNLTHAGGSTGERAQEVWINHRARLTLWADDYEFVSARRTRSTLVFAALNGTIDGGNTTQIAMGNLTTASSVACDVDIEAVDDILSVGNAPRSSSSDNNSSLPVLSSTEDLVLSTEAPRRTRLNEMLLWFAVAPLLTGNSAEGTQPMFTNSTGLPLADTMMTPSTQPDGSSNSNRWTIPGLESFIRLSIGALAQVTSANTNPGLNMDTNGVTVLTTSKETRKLDRARALLLIIPPAAAVVSGAVAAVLGTVLHAWLRMPVMRLAGSDLGEVLKSSQTAGLREVAGADAAKPYLPHELGSVRVRYGVDRDGVAGFVDVSDNSGGAHGGGGGGARGSPSSTSAAEKDGRWRWGRQRRGEASRPGERAR